MRSSTLEGAGLLGGCLMVLLVPCLIFLKLWLVGSLLTSGIKAISGHCGQTYGIESVVSGNWFCPDR
jgi:hypothetical protein